MGLKSQIDHDLKQALLGGDKLKANTLRGLKSAILNEEIARGVREPGLDEDSIILCLKKEVKKRQEAALLYEKAGSIDRAQQEQTEQRIIEEYLPAALSDDEITRLVNEAIARQETLTAASMGAIIGYVKKAAGPAADGAIIARIAKEKLQEKL